MRKTHTRNTSLKIIQSVFNREPSITVIKEDLPQLIKNNYTQDSLLESPTIKKKNKFHIKNYTVSDNYNSLLKTEFRRQSVMISPNQIQQFQSQKENPLPNINYGDDLLQENNLNDIKKFYQKANIKDIEKSQQQIRKSIAELFQKHEDEYNANENKIQSFSNIGRRKNIYNRDSINRIFKSSDSLAQIQIFHQKKKNKYYEVKSELKQFYKKVDYQFHQLHRQNIKSLLSMDKMITSKQKKLRVDVPY